MKLLIFSFVGLFGLTLGHAPFGDRFEDAETFTDSDELPYAGAMFKVSRSPPSFENDTVEMMCQLSKGQSLIDPTCTFKTPDGQMLSFEPEEDAETPVLDENGVEVVGITGGPSTAQNNRCQLTIAAVQLEHFGRWYCYLNSPNTHIGTLTLLNKEKEMYIKDVRLPGHITPSEYSIDLEPHIEEGDFTIDGMVEMTFTVGDNIESPELLRRIFLHAKNILIYEGNVEVYLKSTPSVQFNVVGHEYGFERDFYVIHLEKDLPQGEELVVSISFTSYLNDHLTGFYRSSYVDQETGEEKYLAVTQFESHYARQAFPCMDEPDKKAMFNVVLRHDSKFTARSNMDYFKEENFDNLTVSTFIQSVPMSTYLVAFLVSDFGFTVDVNNKDYKIWHQKSKMGQADLAAANGAKILEFYEKFFDVAYPLPKMDMAAIPDFSAGAMENWGLITYRETLLLFVEGVSDADNYESIIKVMAHELAHQWFGNLVTMKWWTDLWLNEGFATYTQYHAMNEVFPESRARDRMVLYDLQMVFGPDALENTSPLSKEVNNPNYDADFGAIEYSKGCSILRMLENFLTLDTFKKGVSNYLKEKSFQNAEMDDLWMALSNAAREDNRLPPEISVKDIMDGWTLQEGYPVVKVDLSENNFVQLSQKRFYLNPSAKETSNSTWLIPINLAYPKAQDSFVKTTASDWMLSTGTKLNLFVQQKPYIINIQETGYYRVNYDNQNWNDLIKVLAKNHSDIHELNRAQLIDDSMNLARANQVSYEIALGLTEYLAKEREYIPWQSAFRSFSFIDLMLNDNSSLTEFSYLQSYITDLLRPFYLEIGFHPQPGDDHIRKLTRKSLLTWLCKYGYNDCVETSKALFEGFMKNPSKNPVEADLREVVYGTAIRNGGDAEWDFLWEMYLKETIDSERNKMIYALGASVSEKSITRYLEETLESNVRLQDVIYVYRGIGAYAPGRRFQFEWLKSNWEKIREYFSERFDGYVINLIDGYSRAANTEREIKILEDFLEEKRPELGTAIYEIQRLIETAKINLSWMNENKETVANWLSGRNPEATTTTPSTPITTSGSLPTLKSSFSLFTALIFVTMNFFLM